MYQAEDSSLAGSAVTQVLDESHCWLEEHDYCDDDLSDDGVVCRRQCQLSCGVDAESKADDKETQGDQLQWGRE